MRARPRVWLRIAVGLESGNTIGFGVRAAISRTAGLGEDTRLAVRAYQYRGCNVADDGLEVVVAIRFETEATQLVAVQREGTLVVPAISFPPFHKESIPIHRIKTLISFLLAQSRVFHDQVDQLRDPNARSAEAEQGNPLLLQRDSRNIDGREKGPSATAAVPWMSSLNVQSRSR